MRRGEASRPVERGFTLLELMIVVTILAILAGIGVPQYVSALRTARTGKAKHELVTISHVVDAYRANNGGQLPLTLYQVGFGGKRDPWGVPYCYLNYGDGTGDGLDWAIEAGIVDPSAVKGGSPASGSAPVGGLRGAFLPFALGGLPQDQGPEEVQIVGPLGRGPAGRTLATAIAAEVAREVAPGEMDDLVASISGASTFSMFTAVPTEATRRRDRYMFPLNTDYDLFSLGPDGATTVSLGETMGQDDVIRANNGGFFGVAADY